MMPIPNEGDHLTMVKAGTTFRLGQRLNQGGQGVVHMAVHGDSTFAVKWLRPFPCIDELRKSIGSLTDRDSPHESFIWPIDLVTSGHVDSFGYIMNMLDSRFVSVAKIIPVDRSDSPVDSNFRTLTTIGRNLVDAFAALHGQGLCYRDISFGNLWVDPVLGDVRIIDNDNVGGDEGVVFIRGTGLFMAPEIVRDTKQHLPSTVTDLYSLAVLLFHIFMRGHPLDGMRSDSTFSWIQSQHVSQTELHLRNYGFDPLFVFDPYDASNRPPPGDIRHTMWSLYPGFFRQLFVTSFTTGLHDASLTGRVMEAQWRRALLRLADCLSECRCGAAIFYDPGNPTLPCWRCGRVPPLPTLLNVRSARVVLSDGSLITSHHLHNDYRYDEIVGVVEAPRKRSQYQVVLRNKTTSTWTVTPEGEEPRKVEPEQRLGVRPMVVDFGGVEGTIRLAEGAAVAAEQ